MAEPPVIRIGALLKRLGVVDPYASMEELAWLVRMSATKLRRSGRSYTPNPERGLLIFWLIRALNLDSFFEIGTSRGYSTLCAALAFASNGIKDAMLVSVDRDASRLATAARNAGSLDPDVWQRHYQLVHGETPEVLTRFSSHYDIVFVDGGHEATSVLADGRWALKAARQFVVFDDYNPKVWPGVVEACQELMHENSHLVWMLVDSDRRLYQPELRMWTKEDLHGMLIASRVGLDLVEAQTP